MKYQVWITGLLSLLMSVQATNAQNAVDGKTIGTETPIIAADHLGERRYALIIGINDYEDGNIPDLTLCENDARAMRDTLSDPAIGGIDPADITLLLGVDATFRNIRKALNALSRIPADSTVYVFFSGHGAKERDEAYWITQDAELSDLAATAFPNREVRAFLGNIPAKRVIVMLDCCYAAATVKGNKTAAGDFTEVLEKFTGTGRAFLMAAGSGEEAIEAQDLKRSVFTHYLIKGLRGAADAAGPGGSGGNGDGVIVLPELTNYIDKHVADEARIRGGIQKPVVHMDVQEPAKFRLSINAERLRKRQIETAEVLELRATRMAKLRELHLDGRIDRTQRLLGERLVGAEPGTLKEYDARRLSEFIAMLDGELAPEKLVVALSAIRPPGPATLTVPDEYGTIQSAIDAALEGDTIFVKAGTYDEALKFEGRKNLTLRGENKEAVVICCTAPETSFILVKNSDSITIQGFTLKHIGSDEDDDAEFGIDIRNSSSIVVSGCVVDSASTIGVLVYDGREVTVKQCLISGNRTVGILVIGELSIATIIGNECRNNGRDGIVFSNGARGQAENNSCMNNKVNGISVQYSGTAATLAGNECLKNGKVGIYFSDGAKGRAERNRCEDNGQVGIGVAGPETNPVLTNNECLNNQMHGIGFAGGAGGRAEGNTCKGNTIAGIHVKNPGTSPTLTRNECGNNEQCGIYFEKGSGGLVENNICDRNAISGIVVFDSGTAPTLTGNECRYNEECGIEFRRGAGGQAEGNTCVNNKITGILIAGNGTSPKIRHNICQDNGAWGILSAIDASPIIESNNIVSGIKEGQIHGNVSRH